MTAGRMAKLVMAVVLFATGTYVFIYLWRWEWNRALLAGVMFIAAEVAMATVMVLERLGRIDRRLREAPSAAALNRLQETAPDPHHPFAWLQPRQDRFGVFVPILMGVGVVASALAWVVERLARATARPALERGLAVRLQPLAWPDLPLDQSEQDVRSLLGGPQALPAE
ncbi:MAG: hypothetical protein ABR540_06860 [Acidimicrobiales bacterium]